MRKGEKEQEVKVKPPPFMSLQRLFGRLVSLFESHSALLFESSLARSSLYEKSPRGSVSERLSRGRLEIRDVVGVLLDLVDF